MTGPRLSVVLAAIDDYSVVEEVHRCLEAQTIRQSLELVLVGRTEERLALPVGFGESYPDIVVLHAGEHVLLHEAREAGIRRASAPYALILEDHCLPFPDCLEHLLSRLEEGWTAVGPAFVGGNTVAAVAIAANILTYGQWMGWSAGGVRTFVSGFNSAFSVESLLARGTQLTEDLVAPSTAQMALAREGHQFYFEPRARMAHWEGSTYAGVREILTKNGRGLGMLRARRWSVLQKSLASVLTPLLFGHRVVRASGACRRLKERSPQVLLYLVPLTLIWTLGELAGYWCVDRRGAIAGVSDVEHNRWRFVDAGREPIRRPF
jgi:hypothetical protein